MPASGVGISLTPLPLTDPVKKDARGAESNQVSLERCPQCAAAVRPDARWCSLCHAALGTTPEPVPTVVEVEANEVAAADGIAVAPQVRGRHAKGRAVPTVSPVAVEELPTRGDVVTMPLLAAEAEDPEGQLAMFDDVVDVNRIDMSVLADRPVVTGFWGDLASHLDSNGAKAVVMVGGALLMTGVLFGLLALVGSFLS